MEAFFLRRIRGGLPLLHRLDGAALPVCTLANRTAGAGGWIIAASAARRWQESDVNRDRLVGKWKQVSGRVRERWGILTDDRSSVVAGRHDRLAGKHQESYGLHREESERVLRDFLRRHRSWDAPRR
jgi:uncharacterized protein YjbJ (UPF0337 family)